MYYYRQQLQQLNRYTTRWLYANGTPQKWFYVKSNFGILKLYVLAVSIEYTLREQPWRHWVRTREVVLDSSPLWHIAGQDRLGRCFIWFLASETQFIMESRVQDSWASHITVARNQRTHGLAGFSFYPVWGPTCGMVPSILHVGHLPLVCVEDMAPINVLSAPPSSQAYSQDWKQKVLWQFLMRCVFFSHSEIMEFLVSSLHPRVISLWFTY